MLPNQFFFKSITKNKVFKKLMKERKKKEKKGFRF